MRQSRRIGSLLSHPAFRRWFGESKVVDESGEPLTLYHATFSRFDVFRVNFGPSEYRQVGFHVGPYAAATARVQIKIAEDRRDGVSTSAEEAVLLPLYVRAENPLRLDENRLGRWGVDDILSAVMEKAESGDLDGIPDELLDAYADDALVLPGTAGRVWTDHHDFEPGERSEILIRFLNGLGYDSIVYMNEFEGGGDSYLLFDPTQAKSATDNIGTYDPSDPSILRNMRGSALPYDRPTARHVERIDSNPRVSVAGVEWNRATPVFHATTALRAVLRHGLKSRAQLMEETGSRVEAAGGQHDTTISFTSDSRVAESIAYTIWNMSRLARGELKLAEFRDRLIAEQPDVYAGRLATSAAEFLAHAEQVDEGWVRQYERNEWVWVPGTPGSAQSRSYALEAYTALAHMAQQVVDWPIILSGVSSLAKVHESDLGVLEARLALDWIAVHRRDLYDLGVIRSLDDARAFDESWGNATMSFLWETSRGRAPGKLVSSPINTQYWNVPEGIHILQGAVPSTATTGEYNAGEAEIRVWNPHVIRDMHVYKSLDQIAHSLEWFGDEPPLYYPAFQKSGSRRSGLRVPYLGDDLIQQNIRSHRSR